MESGERRKESEERKEARAERRKMREERIAFLAVLHSYIMITLLKYYKTDLSISCAL